MDGRKIDGKQLGGFSQLRRVDRSRVLPDTRWTEECWRHSSNKRLRRKEGGRRKREWGKEGTGAKNSSTTSGQHNRSALPAIFYFTTVPANIRLTSLSCLPVSLSPPLIFRNIKPVLPCWHQRFMATISAFCGLRKAECKPTHGRYSSNRCMPWMWIAASKAEHLQRVTQSILLHTWDQTQDTRGHRERTEWVACVWSPLS